MRGLRLPRDLPSWLTSLHEPGSDVRLIICSRREQRGALLTRTMTIQLPLLRLREHELPWIVDEYAKEAIAALDAEPSCFTAKDRSWVISLAESLPEIEKATLRIVAVNMVGRAKAAALLGMAPVSLYRWLERRKAQLERTSSQPRQSISSSHQ